MNRDTATQILAGAKPELQRRFGVTRLALFGSTARNEAHSDSDVDVLVAFDGPASAGRYFGVQFYLEDLLGLPRRSGNGKGAARRTQTLYRTRGNPCLSAQGITAAHRISQSLRGNDFMCFPGRLTIAQE